MDKIIFLDIDGVLNSEKEINDWIETNPGVCFYPDSLELSPAKIALLKQIIDATKASIVLSSSWRTIPHERKKVIDMCEDNNFKYIGETPDGVYMDKKDFDRCQDLHISPSTQLQLGPHTYDRGAEILQYIKENSITNTWITIDDEDFDIKNWITPDHIVKTTAWDGLTEEKVKEAIQKLK